MVVVLSRVAKQRYLLVVLLVTIGCTRAETPASTQGKDEVYIGVDPLSTCLKNLQDARAALIDGGVQDLVDTIRQQYDQSTLPGDNYVFCFETPEDPENWNIREAIVHPFIESGVPDGERLKELAEEEISHPTWGYGTEIARLVELSLANQDGPLFLYYFHIDQDSLASSGKSVPSEGIKREYLGFSNTVKGANGTELILDCGCPLNLVSDDESVIEVSSKGMMLGATAIRGVLLLLIVLFVNGP